MLIQGDTLSHIQARIDTRRNIETYKDIRKTYIHACTHTCTQNHPPPYPTPLPTQTHTAPPISVVNDSIQPDKTYSVSMSQLLRKTYLTGLNLQIIKQKSFFALHSWNYYVLYIMYVRWKGFSTDLFVITWSYFNSAQLNRSGARKFCRRPNTFQTDCICRRRNPGRESRHLPPLGYPAPHLGMETGYTKWKN